jgi:hypothetical protein
MAALPFSAIQQRQHSLGHPVLVPRTGGQLQAEQDRIVRRMRIYLHATLLLAAAALLAIVLMPFSGVPGEFRFGAQEGIAVSVFATCLFMLHARAELELHLYNYEPVEQTQQGELRALLHHVPEGASYQEALAADNRTFITGEVDAIRRRAEAFKPKAEGLSAE